MFRYLAQRRPWLLLLYCSTQNRWLPELPVPQVTVAPPASSMGVDLGPTDRLCSPKRLDYRLPSSDSEEGTVMEGRSSPGGDAAKQAIPPTSQATPTRSLAAPTAGRRGSTNSPLVKYSSDDEEDMPLS